MIPGRRRLLNYSQSLDKGLGRLPCHHPTPALDPAQCHRVRQPTRSLATQYVLKLYTIFAAHLRYIRRTETCPSQLDSAHSRCPAYRGQWRGRLASLPASPRFSRCSKSCTRHYPARHFWMLILSTRFTLGWPHLLPRLSDYATTSQFYNLVLYIVENSQGEVNTAALRLKV